MEKNQYGRPFLSVKKFQIYENSIVIPKYVDGKVTSKGSVVKSKRQLVRNANQQDIRENIQNMYSWGFKASLTHDLFVGKYGAVVCLIEDEWESVEDLAEHRTDIKELVEQGYKLEIGPGFDISLETGKVKPKHKMDQKSKNRALYCINFKKFLNPDMDDLMRDVAGIPPFSDDYMRAVADFSPYLEIDGQPEHMIEEENNKKSR